MKPVLFLLALYFSGSHPTTIGKGEQPRLSRDSKGVVRVVYGQKEKIFCATSIDNGQTFSTPTLVAEVPGMHLGMSRGPQVASSAKYSIITAMDKNGNIHWFRLNHSSGSWQDMGTINDTPGSAPEGLMGLTADKEDNFYAVWLDIRTGKHNQIYFSSLAGNSKAWSPNRLLYQSPDGHVCECCKPNVSAEGKNIAVMFRNWLDGSRDLYLIQSTDQGQSFGKAKKLGEGTWKLNGCPMDGGGVAIDVSGVIHTVWQRKGVVYYCRPDQEERSLGEGRACSIASNGKTAVISMQKGDTLKLIHPGQNLTTVIGTGSFLQSFPLPGNSILCVWEQDGAVQFKKE
jgi:hypothetical protein